ncbi:hypothetical protein BD410DRAFT_803605 [Rickenella mellea]|uniref:Uncharacterized protein n=1 Tax=Rickenella mellea TaxID=50990 RepID=A0A4Y7Q497_9AGAM|nr:hypothetical protein BD410DRAFT_803605 [Rickenella mellea]
MINPPADPQDPFSYDVRDVPAYSQYISPIFSNSHALSTPLFPSPAPQNTMPSPDRDNVLSPLPPQFASAASSGDVVLSLPPPSQDTLSTFSLDHASPPSPPSQTISSSPGGNNVLSAASNGNIALSNGNGKLSVPPPSPVISAASNGNGNNVHSLAQDAIPGLGHIGVLSPTFSANAVLSPVQPPGDDDHVILFTVHVKSGKSTTWIQHGAGYLSYFKETLPSFFADRSRIYGNFNLAIRQRLFKAFSPSSVHVELPTLRSGASIVSAALLASSVVETVKGTGLVSTFSWNVRGETHILDVIRIKALQRFIDNEVIMNANTAYAELCKMRAAHAATIYSFDRIDEYDDAPNLTAYDNISDYSSD